MTHVVDVTDLLGRKQVEGLHEADYTDRLTQVLEAIEAAEDDAADLAAMAHTVLSQVIDDHARWPDGGFPPRVQLLVRILQTRHLELAGELDPVLLARWLGRNYATGEDRMRLPLGPYLTHLGQDGIEALIDEVRRIDRFSNPGDVMSTSRLLARELALHTADVDQIIAEFGHGLRTADDFLGVTRAFQIAGLPLQAEAFALRGSRLCGASAFACRMVLLEFQLTRDPAGTLAEAQDILRRYPTREVSAVIRRSLGENWAQHAPAVEDALAQLDPVARTECLLGLGQPGQALQVLLDHPEQADVWLVCQTIDLISESAWGSQFAQQATDLLETLASQWTSDDRARERVHRSLEYAESIYPGLDIHLRSR